jgi:hypothetical protein
MINIVFIFNLRTDQNNVHVTMLLSIMTNSHFMKSGSKHYSKPHREQQIIAAAKFDLSRT